VNEKFKPIYLGKINLAADKQIPALDTKFRQRTKQSRALLKQLTGTQAETPFNATAFSKLNSGAFKTVLDKEADKYRLNITAGAAKITIAPESGAVITHWIVDGKDVVKQPSGKIGFSRFYLPRRASNDVSNSFQLKSQTITDGQLKIVFEHHFAGKLASFTLRKSYLFAPNGTSFKLKCTIINSSIDSQMIGFWIWNSFSAGAWEYSPQLRTGDGTLLAGKNNATVFYQTREAPQVKELLKKVDYKNLLGAKTIIQQSSAGAVVISSNADDIAGVLSWAVSKKKFNTLELLFVSKLLKPNQQVEYQVEYKYIK
jgi:hypothetical protein